MSRITSVVKCEPDGTPMRVVEQGKNYAICESKTGEQYRTFWYCRKKDEKQSKEGAEHEFRVN